MKITVLGARNVGSVLAVRFSQHNDVTLYVNSGHLCVDYRKGVTVYSDNVVIMDKNRKPHVPICKQI